MIILSDYELERASLGERRSKFDKHHLLHHDHIQEQIWQTPFAPSWPYYLTMSLRGQAWEKAEANLTNTICSIMTIFRSKFDKHHLLHHDHIQEQIYKHHLLHHDHIIWLWDWEGKPWRRQKKIWQTPFAPSWPYYLTMSLRGQAWEKAGANLTNTTCFILTILSNYELERASLGEGRSKFDKHHLLHHDRVQEQS